MELRLCITSIITLLVFVIPITHAVISSKLAVGFYDKTCPQAEKIITDVMTRMQKTTPGTVPGVMRLHFHDCFITGCDGTILLKPEKYNSLNVEQAHPANGLSLRGMDVIDAAKAELEKQCPGIVSCADTLAFAARDAVVLAGNPPYAVPSGRRDGLTVDGNFAEDLPKGSEDIPVLQKKYEVRGLTLDDMVVLEGSHSIGQTRCLGSIADLGTLANVSGSEQQLDKNLQTLVKTKYCNGDPGLFFNMTAPLNPNTGDTNWGISFYQNILKGYSLLPCDLGMAVNPSTKDLVQKYANEANANLWKQLFNEAMVKLGKVNVLTGEEGEVRRDCKYINSVNQPVKDEL